MPRQPASVILAKWALPISASILHWCTLPKSGVEGHLRSEASTTAATLHIIKSGLESIPTDETDPVIEELCGRILGRLGSIYRGHGDDHETEPSGGFDALFSANMVPGTSLLKIKRLGRFFCLSEYRPFKRDLERDCLKLHQELFVGESPLPLKAQNPNTTGQWVSFSNEAYLTLEQHVRCHSTSHRNETASDDRQSCHPARICLGNRYHNRPSFNFLVSSMDMTYWQEFLLEIERESDPDIIRTPIDGKSFCSIIDEENNARIPVALVPSRGLERIGGSNPLQFAPAPGIGVTLAEVLDCYELGPEHKLVLAYNIATAYMTFWESDLMRKKWSSSSIHFMLTDSEDHDAPMPMKAYLSFLSGSHGEELPEFVDDGAIRQPYPRLFDLGVLLLEVGLGKKFPHYSGGSSNGLSRMNGDYTKACNYLRRLKESDWRGFRHKSDFETIAERCIKIEASARGRKTGSTRTMAQVQDLDSKGILFKEVVSPLGRLVIEGFEYDDQKTICLSKKHVSSDHGQDLPAHTSAHLHSGHAVHPLQWLPNLHQIGCNFASAGPPRPVIAILDTGLDMELLRSMFGEDASRRIRFKDFVAGLKMTDTFGHGTLMTALAMKCAPLATIVVARIAENTKDLERRPNEIVQGIEWASGGEQRADVISMSFGFPKTNEALKEAIERVKTARGSEIIFLASAGNSPSENVSFPARHDSVMSIDATDPYGFFLKSSPRHDENGPVALGTYGDGLPPEFVSAILERYPEAALSGSSIATAVAAGISATMIAYVDALPKLGISSITEQRKKMLRLLRTTRGMEALFRRMKARPSVNRQLWVDPISFWRDHGSHDARYRAILGCMEHFVCSH